MDKRFLILLALLVFSCSAFAISAQDAINFATKQNSFLYSGEEAEIFPNTRIGIKGNDFWVITILSSGTLTGFVPVSDEPDPGLPASVLERRELIKTAYALRYERQLNESSSRQDLWVFDAKNVKSFYDLSQDLKNEKVDLATVKTSLSGFPEMQAQVDSLGEMLDEMHPIAADLSDSLLEATSFESSFVAGPDTNRLKDFEKHFEDSFALIHSLDKKRLEYLAELDSLRQAIALSSLSIETKQGLNALANVPSSLQQFGSRVTLFIDLEESLSEVFDKAAANADNLVSGLATREERNTVFQAIYGTDSEVLGKTGRNSLSQLFELLLSDDYFYRWKNQPDLSSAKENWNKTMAFYNSGSFKQAEQYAVKSKRFALNVFEAGLEEEEPAFDTDLLFSGLFLLIIAVILIYAFRNRDRISRLVSGNAEEAGENDWS